MDMQKLEPKARGDWVARAWLGGALAVALALRLVYLTSQSFWYDEGWTSWAIGQSWREMFGALARDNHPPLYFVVLRLWATAFGRGDLALRGFSVLCGLATVASLYAVGCRLWGRAVGGLAALLAAVNPALVMYSQEARMYSLATALVLTATYCLVRILADASGRRRWLGCYAFVMAAALYTHHHTWLAFGAHGLVLLTVAALRRDRLALAACPLVFTLWLPLLPYTLHQASVARTLSWRPHIAVPLMLKDLAGFLTLGDRGQGHALPVASLGGLALAAVGLGLGWLAGKARWALTTLGVATPVGAACVAQTFLPLYTGRYMLYLAPFFCLLAALGAWTLAALLMRGRCLRAMAFVVLSALAGLPMAQALARYYGGQGWLRSDFRAVAAHLEEAARPGDALALVQTAPPLLQYYRGGLSWRAFPDVSMQDYVTDEQEVALKLKAIARPGACIWWVGSDWDLADPQNLVEAQLREHCDYWDERWWQESPRQTPIRVATYVVRDTDFGPLARTPLTADFGPVELTGYDVQRDSKGRLYVALWWSTLVQPEKDYNAFVHLIDQDGAIVAQGDHIPVNPYYPIGQWKSGQTWRDEHTLTPPPGVEVEKLRLRVGLSWGEKGENQLQIVGGPSQGQTYVIVPVSQ
ncbi:MAG: glycosyltransferase family 39 protein [Anaerolineae bacterium]|nr:glycosyltransferase family 39 protein [Anaerolineae bacterium]